MKGKIQGVAFKIVAVVSALAIGGGYVFWRQSEARKAEHLESVERAKVKEDKETLLLSGSKSYTGGTLIMEGDLAEDGLLLPRQEEGEEALIPQELLPSSKIGLLHLRSEETEPLEGKKFKLLPGSKSAPMEIIPEEPVKSK